MRKWRGIADNEAWPCLYCFPQFFSCTFCVQYIFRVYFLQAVHVYFWKRKHDKKRNYVYFCKPIRAKNNARVYFGKY